MSLIFGRGKHLSVQFLYEWLGKADLTVLDQALCNIKLRDLFLSWIKEYSNIFVPKLITSPVPFHSLGKAKTWSSNRFLNASDVVADITFDEYSFVTVSKDETLFQSCSSVFPFVKNIEFRIHNHDPSHLAISINVLTSCRHVSGLLLRRAPDSMYEVVAKLYSSLISIDLSGLFSYTRPAIEPLFSQIIRSNPGLTDVNVRLTHMSTEFMNALIVHTRRIKHLNIISCTLFTSRDRLRLSLHGCLHLMSFSVGNVFNVSEMKCLLQYQNLSSLTYLDYSNSNNPYISHLTSRISKIGRAHV